MRVWYLMAVAGCGVMLAGAATQAQAATKHHKATQHAEAAGKDASAQANATATEAGSGVIRKTTDDGRTIVTHAPIPDTPENRALHGGPNSHAGRNTKPAGN